MSLLKSLVLTHKKADIGHTRHSSLAHFLDLIDACGYDLKVTDNIPLDEHLGFYKLIFVDASNQSATQLFTHPIFTSSVKNKVVFFAVSKENAHIETTALRNGVRGVFYECDKLENLIKGIQTIKNGKFWFKRETLEETVKQLLGDLPSYKRQSVNKVDDNTSLTKREKMIVGLIGQGAKNVEIAEQLHISINTVKTHVYSIFRKTNCRNRVELIKWSLDTSIVAS